MENKTQEEKEDSGTIKYADIREKTPTKIWIADYWKYEFTISFEVDGKTFRVGAGGCADDIYRFNAFGGWDEWEAAGIRWLFHVDEEGHHISSVEDHPDVD